MIPTVLKKARGRWKLFQTTPPDEATLSRLFARQGITGLAVLLGSASGRLVCRDFDRLQSYESWAQSLPHGRDTADRRHGRGRHVYFCGPEDFVDLGTYRGTSGHYCLLPPSIHPDGPIYTWAVPLPDNELPALDPDETGLRRSWAIEPYSSYRGCNTADTEGARGPNMPANIA